MSLRFPGCTYSPSVHADKKRRMYSIDKLTFFIKVRERIRLKGLFPILSTKLVVFLYIYIYILSSAFVLFTLELQFVDQQWKRLWSSQ